MTARTIALLSWTTTLLAASTVAAAEGRGLIAHWAFDAAHTGGGVVKDQAGDRDATITGPVKLRTYNGIDALLVDRDANRVTAPAGATPLPADAITVEAWLRVDKTVEWGIIIAAVSRDRGWQLGYRQSSFSFSVNGKGAKGITHLRDRSSLAVGRWYHVVGTYDGTMQRLYVDGRLENTAEAQSGPIDYADNPALAIGSYGKFHPRSWLHEIRIYRGALGPDEVAARHRAKRGRFPDRLTAKIGPYLERLDRSTIMIRWETERPEPSIVAFGTTLPVTDRVVDETPTTTHEVRIDGLARERLYYYRIASARREGEAHPRRVSRLYEFDSTFDYTPVRVPDPPSPYAKDALTAVYERAAERILRETDVRQGFCLVLGAEQGRLAYEIARRTDFQVLCVDDDDARIAAARKALDRAGLYGVRVSVQKASLAKLPFRDYLANLIVSDRLLVSGDLPGSAAEMFRVLRPAGGVAVLGRPAALAQRGEAISPTALKAWLAKGAVPDATVSDDDGVWAVVRRGPVAGGGTWSHQYGDAGNSANSNDTTISYPMRVLWFGRPGPRPMLDRGTRAPAPLSTAGRLFVQGDRRLFALDAYNGTILWTLEIPDLRRANIPRDGSNMTATDDALYVAVRDRCWVLDAATGKKLATYAIPGATDAKPVDWGYIACVGDILYGSAVRRGGLFVGADGEWYDKAGGESDKVVSEFLFALDRHTGKPLWTHRGAVLINSTLSIGDDRVYFVESRSEDAAKIPDGRMGKEIATDHYLVALDRKTGKPLYQEYFPFQEGRYVFYLTYARDTLIALTSSDRYHIYGFNAADGKPLWQKSYEWHRDHHGGTMQHPTIVGDTVFAEPQTFDLRTGAVGKAKMPARSGCGAMSASANCLFYRDGYHGMWDLEQDKRSKWTGLRPGCWLGIIPAGGVLLAPETSAGCFCAQPIQTSIAFLPTGGKAEK